jgi:carbonic anhydrase
MPESGQHNADSGISIQPNSLLPKNSKQFYTYAGSLTTPPCSEGVIWYILSKPLGISKDQLIQLKALNQSNESYPNNNRLLQNLNSRVPTRLITK